MEHNIHLFHPSILLVNLLIHNSSMIERFSLEYRKLIAFALVLAFTALSDWLKNLASLSRIIIKKSKIVQL